MSEHHTHLLWNNTRADFDYQSYDRSHRLRFGGGIEVALSAAPEFLGNAQLANPEEMLVGAISSCHMLTFLALAAKKRFHLKSYEDSTVGILEKDTDGVLRITRTELHPKTVFDPPIPVEALQKLHDQAHHHCFIAQSVKTQVTVVLS